MKLDLFEKEYDGESLGDLWKDTTKALDTNYSDIMKRVHCDEMHIPKGVFKVTITWEWNEWDDVDSYGPSG